MSAALAGDERAYRQLLRDVSKLAARVARKGLRGLSLPAHDVEDIVQETLLAVHLNRSRWRPEAGVQAWVAAIARYKTIDAARRSFSRRTTPLDNELDLATPVSDASSARIDVGRLMTQLRPRHRLFVSEVMLRGCTVAEVAQRLDMTAVAGRVTLHRAIREMSALATAPVKTPPSSRPAKRPARSAKASGKGPAVSTLQN